MELLVKNNYLFLENKKYQCAVGKNGLTKNKIEGDLCTPLGVFQFNKIFYRPDRLGEIKFLINSEEKPLFSRSFCHIPPPFKSK